MRFQIFITRKNSEIQCTASIQRIDPMGLFFCPFLTGGFKLISYSRCNSCLVKSNQQPVSSLDSETVMYALNKENLKESAKRIAGNKAVGIDNVTKQEYMTNVDSNINELIGKMKRMAYRPKAVRRVYIPKPGSEKKRPLGIPAYEDKIVQDVMTQILNAIYEPMFKEFSYGFRPNRSCHQAIAYLDKMLHRYKSDYVVDLDIKGFFDNIDHEWLIKFLEYRINDRIFIRYIRRFLKSGILEE